MASTFLSTATVEAVKRLAEIAHETRAGFIAGLVNKYGEEFATKLKEIHDLKMAAMADLATGGPVERVIHRIDELIAQGEK
jgi:hypothetical protein